MDSQADTYIEECFEQKCFAYKDFKEVLNQWRKDKDNFCEYTSITNFDFQHYSMHDKTHSIAILQNIEMVLGRERVGELNASNLWLLLEAAYSHDIGMSVDYKELCSIWESDDFQKFIIDSLDSEMADSRKAGMFYEKLNALVHNKTQLADASKVYDIDEFDIEFDELFSKKSWPVIGERYIMMLYTEYIRNLHPEFSRNRILCYGSSDSDENMIGDEKKIPSRMYRAVALASFLHGEDFEQIFKTAAFEENGFKGERMHPQFAAAMLRLGDLLDMDNNRFNIRMINHIGMIPMKSMLHLKKHKAITHLSYSQNIIEAEARSRDFDVCKTAQQWFYWLDEEVKNLICFWNKIAPPELIGCRLNCCDLKIYYKNELFDASRQTKFVADSARVYKMLIGNNIYKSRLDFIREYLQNALDASKMKLWLNLKKERKFQNDYTWETITPYDLEPEEYEAYKLEVAVHIDWGKQEVEISFQDHGIGIEKDCVNALSYIAGDSWKKRKDYAKEIPNMPMWLRPTGGFGIGIQSAFMITDCVEFLTKTEQESHGRRVCIENSRKDGKVSHYAYREAVNGTKVLIKIPLLNFIQAAMEQDASYLRNVAWNIYDHHEISKIIMAVLHNYIGKAADFSMFPIAIYNDEEKIKKNIGMKWLYCMENGDLLKKKIQLSEEKNLPDNEKGQWNIRYAVEKDEFILWDQKNNAVVIYMYNSGQTQKNSCYYKGIHISGEDFETSGQCALQINYFDYNVGHYLTINRDNFHQSLKGKFQEDVIQYKDLYARLLVADIYKLKNCKVTNEFGLITLMHYALGILDLDTDVCRQLLESVCRKVSVKKLNPMLAEKFLDKLKEAFQITRQTPGYASILENILFIPDQIPLGRLIQDIIENPYFFYEARKEDSPSRIPMYLFAQKIFEPRDSRPAKEDVHQSVDDICQALAQDGQYIITETEICRILQEYSVMNAFVDIKESERYIMRIASARKDDGKNTAAARSLKEFIRNGLREELEIDGSFPIILRTAKIAEDDLKYHLWVKKIFLNTKTVSMDNQKASASDRYLILPITQSIWMSILNIIRFSGKISKQAYNEIVKQRSELMLLANWTYAYQSIEPKVKKEQIYEQYEEILDLIYTDCVEHISGDVYYHLINS